MSFLFPFLNFFQPGIYWPVLAVAKPMLLASVIGLVAGLQGGANAARSAAFRDPIFICLTAFILIQIISLFLHGTATGIGGLAYWSIYLIFVAISVLLIPNVRALHRYVWGMLSGAMVIVAFGIAAALLKWPEAVGGRAGAYGMYENHNDYSFIIIQILPFLFLCRTLSTRLVPRLLLGVSLLACLLGILLSLSRGGMLALVLELGLIIFIGMQGRKRLLWLPVLAVVGMAAIGYQWAKRAENQGDSYTAADAENSRLELWKAGGSMIMAKPLLGVGSAMFAENAQFYGEISHDNRGKNSHNTYLEILTGTGLLGFGTFVTLVILLLRGLHRAALPRGPPVVDAMRRATLIAFYSILLRATLDAKPHDWSFYILTVIGLMCVVLQRQASMESASAAMRRSANPADPDMLLRPADHHDTTSQPAWQTPPPVRRR